MQSHMTSVIEAYDRGQLSRRQLIAHLSGLAGLAALAPGAVAAGDDKTGATFLATDVNHIALTVTDVERSAEFYQRHLGLAVASRGPRNCFLRCAEHNFLALFKGEKPAMNHYCFSVKGYDAGDAVTRLKAAGLEPRRSADRVYFDDPDGLEVQVASKTHGV